jgi:poly(A) polymerase Pap1
MTHPNFMNSWSEVNKFPPSDPLFDLPIMSLKKLNAFRDMDYLQRTIPDLAAFRLAYRFIKAWAQQRGIYSARFGYLGGIHITLLLSRVCKLLFRDAGAITAADIICTFFKHYSKDFDWKSEMAFDPFFYKQRPRYQRSAAREPAVILSLHAPSINMAHAASPPSVRTLVEELKRADRLIEEENVTWLKLIDGEEEGLTSTLPYGARDFLESYNSYIKIDVQYWGTSLTKGSSLIGWLESRCVLLLVGEFLLFPL